MATRGEVPVSFYSLAPSQLPQVLAIRSAAFLDLCRMLGASRIAATPTAYFYRRPVRGALS